MRSFNAMLILPFLAFAAACEQSTSVLTGPKMRLASGPMMVPFKATLTYESSAPIALARCGPGEVGISLTKAGNATHLGRFTVIASQCLDPTSGAITKGEAIFTAANGDKVFATQFGGVSGSPPVLAFELTYTVTGGTGRFAGARGSFRAVGDFVAATGTGSASLNGLLSSPGLN